LAPPISAVLGPGFDARTLAGFGGLTLSVPPRAFASVSPLAATALIALFVGLVFVWVALRGFHPGVRRAASWACGVSLEARMQYSALGFTKPLRLIFSPLLRPERELEILERGSPYFGRKYRFRSGVPPLAERLIFAPLVQAVFWVSTQARRLQAGSLHVYL